jgi:hypothetical protein
MDIRVINTSYSRPPIVLFVEITKLCLEIAEDDGPPNVPYLVPGTGGRMIAQTWGECPFTGGVGVFYSLAEDGDTVQLWDCEEQGYEVDELGPPLYTFPLASFQESMAKWVKGDL